MALAAGVVLKALHQRPNFYSAAVYVAQSSVNLMVWRPQLDSPAHLLRLQFRQIMTNLVFLTACTLMVGLQKLLYGPLRPIEIEQLYEKAWFAVTETCLAMTIFRGEVGGWFLVMLFSLLAGKVWGWVGEGRVEILEQQPPANPRLFHTRLAISLAISVLFDSYMLEYCVKEVLHQARPDMTVMFGFEFAILTIVSTSTAARYAINLTEIYIIQKQKAKRIEEIRGERRAAAQANGGGAGADEPIRPYTSPPEIATTTVEEIGNDDLEVEGWMEKGRWVFYLDIATGMFLMSSGQNSKLIHSDFLKLVVYLSFFFILLIFYALPLHIMRDVFLTIRSFFKRISDFVKYRRATKDMNERYPDATANEVGREDVCIICREEMRPISNANDPNAAGQRPASPATDRLRPKKLPCGHILHFSCLRSWLERQQICPTCRRPVLIPERNQAGGNLAGIDGAAGQPVAFGAVQQGAHAPNGQPADGQGRGRIIQFGPFRIGFGAGRGDMLQDLAQRVHVGEDRPPAAGNQNVRQFGIGFGIGRQAAAQVARIQPPNVRAQLEHVELQIQREIDELRLTANELSVVRMLSGELSRLRSLRANATGGSGAPLDSGSLPHPLARSTPPTSTAFSTTLVPNPQQNVLQAGDAALPEGLTLPQGWSMMPLQRVNAQTHGVVPPPTATQSIPTSTIPPRSVTAAPLNIQTEPIPRPASSASRPQAPMQVDGQRNAVDENRRPSAADPAINGILFGHGLHIPSGGTAASQASSSRNNQTLPVNGESTPSRSQTTSSAPTENTSSTSAALPSWASRAQLTSPQPQLANGHSGETAVPGEQSQVKEKSTSEGDLDDTIAASQDPDTSTSSSNVKGKAKAPTVEDFVGEPD